MLVFGRVTTKEYHPCLRFDHQTSTYGASINVHNNNIIIIIMGVIGGFSVSVNLVVTTLGE